MSPPGQACKISATVLSSPAYKLSRRASAWAAVLLTAVAVVAPVVQASSPGARASSAGRQVPQTIPGAPAEPLDGLPELREGLARMALAAALGTILALRPRHKGQTRRNPLVIQTQIMLCVVGAVIMLVVGQSLARAFGIVGAANLIRYRSTIDDPKEAVVMLCALSIGLAVGVGLYKFAPFATLFMALVLSIAEYFEPSARKRFELKVTTKDAPELRPKVEGVLTGFQLEFELLSESDEELGYGVIAPITVRTSDISDTIRLVSGAEGASIEWDEKKNK